MPRCLSQPAGQGRACAGLADGDNHATEAHQRPWRAWSEGGAGFVITGDVQVDRRDPQSPDNYTSDPQADEKALAALSINRMCAQLLRIGRGQAPAPAMDPLRGMMAYLANEWRGVRALQGR